MNERESMRESGHENRECVEITLVAEGRSIAVVLSTYEAGTLSRHLSRFESLRENAEDSITRARFGGLVTLTVPRHLR